MPHVIRQFERPASNLLAEIGKFAPATLHEAQGRRGALDSRLKPIFQGMRAAGPALTASCHPADNLMLITAISLAQPGDFLIIAAGDRPEQGGFGEVLATACRAKGVVGLLTDAGARDGTALKEMNFPVFCYGLCMKGTVKETLGTINQPVVIGGQLINPGDYVSADDDGVVVVRKEEIAEIARASAAREDKEAKIMQALRDGGDVLELTGMAAVLKAKNCTYG
jgi:4-hydroxy-4-methyl-2-oxoglutarate aldolase